MTSVEGISLHVNQKRSTHQTGFSFPGGIPSHASPETMSPGRRLTCTMVRLRPFLTLSSTTTEEFPGICRTALDWSQSPKSGSGHQS